MALITLARNLSRLVLQGKSFIWVTVGSETSFHVINSLLVQFKTLAKSLWFSFPFIVLLGSQNQVVLRIFFRGFNSKEYDKSMEYSLFSSLSFDSFSKRLWTLWHLFSLMELDTGCFISFCSTYSPDDGAQPARTDSPRLGMPCVLALSYGFYTPIWLELKLLYPSAVI